MTPKRNIIWLIIDGVRQYRSGGDDRDRLPLMDDFARESVEFTNAFTAAPSSILSAAAMFTGLPACYVGRHFNDFVFDYGRIDSIQHLLKQNGYHIYSIFDAKACRTSLQAMAMALPARYYPRAVTHHEWWPNREITNIIQHILETRRFQTPSFFLAWYNCRRDPNTSFEVNRALELFKAHGLYDNAIVLMCSDHGYPDPEHGLTREIMKKYSHDMIVTDDNVKIPLFLRYPGGPANISIDDVVGNNDLFATLLELTGTAAGDPEKVNYTCPFRGRSLMDAVESRDRPGRIVRIDTRLTCARGRIAALRSQAHKYIYYCDENREAFYDMAGDPYELKNLIASTEPDVQEAIGAYRKHLADMDNDIHDYHAATLARNIQREFSTKLRARQRAGIKHVLVATTAPAAVVRLLTENLAALCDGCEIQLLSEAKLQDRYAGLAMGAKHYLDRIHPEAMASVEGLRERYDMVIYLTENSIYHFIEPDVVNALKQVKSRGFYMMDYNFNIYSRLLSRWIGPFIRLYRRNKYYYRQEPMLILKDCWSLLKSGIKINIMKKRNHKFNPEEIKIMRDKRAEVFDGDHPFDADRAVDRKKRDAYERKQQQEQP